METLPIEIIGRKIFPIVFSDKDFCIHNFLRLQLISPYFYWLINSNIVLDEICKTKNLVIKNKKDLSIKQLQKEIFNRLYVHTLNIGYNWLPIYMREQPENYDDWHNNHSIKTKVVGKFKNLKIKDRRKNIIYKKNNLNQISILIERHEHFEDMYAVYFKINDDHEASFWTNLDDYKIEILGILYQ